jgi:hypothetical protein
MISGRRARRRGVLRRDPAALVVLVRGGMEVARWPLTFDGPVDLSLVDGLARLQLAARRLDCSLQLHDVCDELAELLAFLGLARAVTGVVAEVVGLPLEPGLEVVGKPEDGEQRRVEEVVVPDDPLT